MSDYFGKDEHLAGDEVQRRFRKRYSLGLWCAVLPCVGFFAAGIAAAKFQNAAFVIVGFFLGLVVLGYVAFVYRCPKCGAVPVSPKAGTTGVLVAPRACSSCGALLLEGQKWTQS